MDSFFKILLGVVRFIRGVSIAFALYGLIWLPRFQNGIAKGPHWLLYLYDSGIPILLGISIIGLIVIFLYNIMMAMIPGQSPSGVTVVFRGLLIWILAMTILGGLPSFVSGFSHMQEIVYDDDSYHLIQRATSGNTVEYFVYKCIDPIGLWCERITATNDLPAPPPTPIPFPTPTESPLDTTTTADVVPEVIIPTVTPPAELISDDLGQLVIKVGEAQAVITSTLPITPSVTLTP